MKAQLCALELDLLALKALTEAHMEYPVAAQEKLENALLTVQRLRAGNPRRTAYRDIPITVRIIKCESSNLWYASQIGAVINVRITKKYMPGYEYKMLGGGYLRKEDCELINKEQP
jgi:hypothetical protein